MKIQLRLTSNWVYDRDCTEFPDCPCFKKKSSSLSRLGLQDEFPSWLEQQSSSTLLTTQWYPKVMCSETWNFPVFGVLGTPWPPGLGEKRGHSSFCRFHSHIGGLFPVLEFMVLVGLVGVVNSISYWIFPSSECTGGHWCSWCLVAVTPSCFLGKTGQFLLSSWSTCMYKSACSSFLLYFQLPPGPPVWPCVPSNGAELWAWCSCPAQKGGGSEGSCRNMCFVCPGYCAGTCWRRKKNTMCEDVQETWRTGCFHSDTFVWNSIWSSDLSLFTAVENNAFTCWS